MALSVCGNGVDRNGRELVQHGSTAFPVACYHDDLSKEEVPWHWHEELEAAIITEGCAIVAVGNEKLTVRSGEGIFINSGILHGAWDLDDSACRFHSMVFHPRLVGGSLDSVFYQNYVQPLMENLGLERVLLSAVVPWQARCLELIESAWQACVYEGEGFEFRVRNDLSELVYLLRRNLPGTEARQSAKTLRDGERIKTMLQFIHGNFAEELNTAMIADAAAISESECLRCFKSTIGTTPIQYLRQYRIQQATILLATTQLRISDIAAACGFQDLSYFTKTFRESKGSVPSEFRKKQ